MVLNLASQTELAGSPKRLLWNALRSKRNGRREAGEGRSWLRGLATSIHATSARPSSHSYFSSCAKCPATDDSSSAFPFLRLASRLPYRLGSGFHLGNLTGVEQERAADRGRVLARHRVLVMPGKIDARAAEHLGSGQIFPGLHYIMLRILSARQVERRPRCQKTAPSCSDSGTLPKCSHCAATG